MSPEAPIRTPSRAPQPGDVYGLVLVLRSLRRSQGMTQASAAWRIGVSRSAVNNWERGCSEPQLTHLLAYARVVGVTLAVVYPAEGVRAA